MKGLGQLRLRGFYSHTELDGNREAYGQMLESFQQASFQHQRLLDAPSPNGELELGLREFDRSMKRGSGLVPPHTLKQRGQILDHS